MLCVIVTLHMLSLIVALLRTETLKDAGERAPVVAGAALSPVKSRLQRWE